MPGPGVVVTTKVRSGPPTPIVPPSGQLFVAGLTERGSVTEPVLVRGMADYERLLGRRVTFGALHDALRIFFAEGGDQAWVARVINGPGTVGSTSFNDRAAVPVPTIRVEAANPGPWSTQLTAEVQNGNAPNTFSLIIRLLGNIVEDVSNLVSPAAEAVSFRNSPFVRVVDLGSTTAPPANNPAVTAPTVLSAGTADTAGVTSAMLVAALARFSVDLGDGAVAIPGQSAATVATGIDLHCRVNRRIGLLAGARGDSATSLSDTASGLNTEYSGLFAPWILMSDDTGGTRAIPPEGYVAAVRNRAHAAAGPWRAPAGAIALAGGAVIGLDQVFSRADAEVLDANRVSVIRPINNTVRLYGWRSLSLDVQNYAFLTGRDTLNRLVTEAERRLEQYVFAPIDNRGHLLAAINAELVGLAEPIRTAGGIYELVDNEGNEIDAGYTVDTGSELNTLSSLANNEVRAQLAVRVSPVGALVSLTIVKVGVTANL